MMDPALANDPIDRTLAKDPIEPSESTDPTEPIDSTELREPIDSREFVEPRLQRDVRSFMASSSRNLRALLVEGPLEIAGLRPGNEDDGPTSRQRTGEGECVGHRIGLQDGKALSGTYVTS